MDPIRKLTGGANLNPIRDRAAVSLSRQSDGLAARSAETPEESVTVSSMTMAIQTGLESEASREAEKTAAISDAYQSGTYFVESSQVARAIVEDALW